MEEKVCSECENLKETLQCVEATLERMEAVLLRMESILTLKYHDEIYEKCGTFRSFA